MQDIPTKITGSSLTAAEFNDIPDELENTITGTGQTLSGANLDQVGIAMAVYSGAGDFVVDSGAADAYVLGVTASKQAPLALVDGLRVRFRVGNTNTGASTANVFALGAKNIFRQGAALNAGDLPVGDQAELSFDLSNDRWDLIGVETLPAATETASGTAEIATQGEVDTGTDDVRFLTPLKLANATTINVPAASVGQGELKTSTGSGTTNVSAGSSASISLTGGTYSWYTLSAADGNNMAYGNGNVAAGIVGVRNNTGGSLDFFRDERFVTASRPYDLGDGVIPLFATIQVEIGTGKLLGVDVSQDPMWAYNGPTNITPQRTTKEGRKYRKYRFVEDMPLHEAWSDSVKRGQILSGALEIEERELEITQAIKNKDMNLIPHNWHLNDTSGSAILLLDPMAPIMQILSDIVEDVGAREVRDLILDGYLEYGNTDLERASPDIVMPVSVKWKNTV